MHTSSGLIRVPVFASAHAGIGYMIGPTGGFLLGFLAAAICVGCLADRGWSGSLGGAAVLMVTGHIVLFVPGLAWLVETIGWARAIDLGLSPFVAAMLVKIVIGVVFVRAVWRVTDRRLPARPLSQAY